MIADPLTWPYARLVGKAYADPGVWQHETLDSGSTLSVRVPAGPATVRVDERRHEVALTRPAPADADADAEPRTDLAVAFAVEVRQLMAYLDEDPRAEWVLAKQGPTKQGGVACRFTAQIKPVNYALPIPRPHEAAHA